MPRLIGLRRHRRRRRRIYLSGAVGAALNIGRAVVEEVLGDDIDLTPLGSEDDDEEEEEDEEEPEPEAAPDPEHEAEPEAETEADDPIRASGPERLSPGPRDRLIEP